MDIGRKCKISGSETNKSLLFIAKAGAIVSAFVWVPQVTISTELHKEG